MHRLGRLAALSLAFAFVMGLSARAGERVVVAADREDLREALTDALEAAGYTVASSGTSLKELGGRPVGDLLADEGLYKEVARKVYDASGAKFLIAAVNETELVTKNEDLGTVQWKSKVTIAAVYGPTGAAVGRAADKGQGTSSSNEKASQKALDQAMQKTMAVFLEKMKEGVAAPDIKTRRMSVKVTELPDTLYESAGLKMRKFLEKIAGASDVTPAYDAEKKTMNATFFFEGTITQLEDKLRADKKFIRDFILIQSDEGGLTFRLNASMLVLAILGHQPDRLQEVGKKVLEELKRSPDAVNETAAYAQGAYEIRFLSSNGAQDVHDALMAALAGDEAGQKLHLNVMAADGLVYRFGGDLLKLKVTGLGPDSYEETGLLLSNVVEETPGVDGVTREYVAAEQAMTLRVFFSGDRTSLENALRRNNKGIGELALLESTGDALTFGFALRSLAFRIRGVQPEIVQREGRAFLDKARGVGGAKGFDWQFASDGDFVVSLLWKGTASQFHAQVEKDLKGFQLVRARDLEAEYAVGGRAIQVIVTGLADGFYENTSRTLSKKIQGLKGTSGIKRYYDASAKALGFVVFFNGDARQLEDALKGKQGGLGELSVSATGEDKLVLAFALRELKVSIEGSEAGPLKDLGAALGEALKKAEGIAEPKWTFDEAAERFDVTLMAKMDAPDLHSAVGRALAGNPLAEKLRLISVRESAVSYRLGELVIPGTVTVKNLPPEALGRIGDALTGALKGLEGVKEAAKTYAEGTKTLTVAVKFAGAAAELDEALWVVVKGREDLAELSPADAGPGRVAYTWRSGEQTVTVKVSNVIPSAYDSNAKAVKDALAAAAGIKVENQAYSEKACEITIELKTKKRAHEIDEAIRATPGGLTLVDSAPDALRYEAPPSMDQQVMMELRGVDVEKRKSAGTAFVAMLKSIKGVGEVKEDYAVDRGAMMLTVIFTGKPVDLDAAIWAATAGNEQFATLYPGDLNLGVMVYEFKAQAATTPVGIAINGVKPTSVADVKAAVDGALAGIAGVKDASESYDDTTEVYAVSLTFEGRPGDLMSSFSKNLGARADAVKFQLKRSFGTECVYQHNPRVDDRGEFALQVSGWREKEDAPLGDALVKAAQGIAGLENVQGSYRPDLFSFVVSFMTKLDASAVDDAVRKALAGNKDLVRVRAGALRDGLLVCGLEPPAGNGEAALPPAIAETRPSLSDLVQKVDPGVVFIQTSLKANKDQAWLGSGFIVSSQGHILTNDHVISVTGPDGKRLEQKDVKVKVKLTDGRWFAATVVATDPEIDAAVIRIKATDMPALDMGDSDALRIGQDLFVIGNPLGLEHSVTTGIVSAFGRMGGRIQTNALINHGNSGGPAFDMQGRVVAISVAGAVANYAFEGSTVEVPQPGINFLIPINQVRPLLEKAGE
ncbi:MAG: trypsin-like peptidase domain-containing protein [Planctomycetes bacterium]|nr:trypsin-like peptidase domain-containing protein [Planctomycetota bacterium]